MKIRPSGKATMALQNMSQPIDCVKNRAGLRVPDGSLEDRHGRDVPRPRHDQHLAGVQEREVNRVDRHQVRQRAPLALHAGLRPQLRVKDHDHGQRKDRNAAPHPHCQSSHTYAERSHPVPRFRE